MAAATTDKFSRTYNAANPNVARVTGTRVAAGASLSCDNLAGWPTATSVKFSTYQINTSNAVIAGTQIDWVGIVSGNTIGSMTRITGASDNGNAVGDVVEMNPTANWADDVMTGILAQHNQDGTHGAVTATSVASSGTVTGTTGVFSSDVSDNATTLKTIRTEYQFDFVASGLVWSGDAYASTKAASMTAGVVYINGQRGSISAVTARTFTASKDTYIDVLNTAGVFSLVYTEVANNAASPALAANSIRIGIIVTGATNIAAAGSVNQGQETMVLPIASSTPYAVTDSLGNLICPRDPSRKILGYRQIISAFSTAAHSATDVTGLNVTVNVPAGRKVKVSSAASYIQSTSTLDNMNGILLDGSTSISGFGATTAAGNAIAPFTMSAVVTPSSSTKTYKVQVYSNAGTTILNANATTPAYILVELA